MTTVSHPAIHRRRRNNNNSRYSLATATLLLALLTPYATAQFLNIDVKIEGTDTLPSVNTQTLASAVPVHSISSEADTILFVEKCGKGTYSNKDGNMCLDCPAGTASAAEGASNPMTCNACSTGAFSAAASSVCTDCPINTFSTTYMASNQTQCLVCPPHSTSPTHSNQVQDCVCDSGFFMSDNILTPFDSILTPLGFEGALSINIPHVIC